MAKCTGIEDSGAMLHKHACGIYDQARSSNPELATPSLEDWYHPVLLAARWCRADAVIGIGVLKTFESDSSSGLTGQRCFSRMQTLWCFLFRLNMSYSLNS